MSRETYLAKKQWEKEMRKHYPAFTKRGWASTSNRIKWGQKALI